MNPAQRSIWHLGTTFALLLLFLSCRMVYWQVVNGRAFQPASLAAFATGTVEHAEAQTPTPAKGGVTGPIAQTPSSARQATAVAEPTREAGPSPEATITPSPTIDLAAIERGTIYDRNGRRLAYDVRGEDGGLTRFYAEPSLAHVVGYLSGARAGVTGIERAYDEALLGMADAPRQAEPPVQGHDLYLTIDSRVQRAAAAALGDRAGAVVVLDAHSGAVLAMVSSPAFDPNRILDPAYSHELQACERNGSCRQALLNRATQGLYIPGSTWKTVTLIAALESGQVTPQTRFDFGPPLQDASGRIYYVYTVDGFSIIDRNHQERTLDLVRCYTLSANAAFARIGDEMPAEVMIEYAARLGFGRHEAPVPPIEIDASAARLARDPQDLHTDNPLRASTAIGQGELLTSPLNMAMVVLAIVRDGDIPAPHLVQSVRDPSGNLITGEPTGYWRRSTMRPETAKLVREFMRQVVEGGTGSTAAVPGLVVGGKTGTAQLGDDSPPHAWFVGFADGEGRTVVVAVLVENGGSGGTVAAPVFAQVAEVAVRHLGEPVQEVVTAPAPH